ncbi:LysR family transcriptional regulator [Chromobacterium violaceum]|uniref:LysR family transcriptional regulator n=1 Tax=Chromobacterium violaceum TaxID=536 RepID=UPI0009D93EC1|nr:LysR family transcriptional regulator [Chromobacterium violaceum]OQS09579.1 LysR family transcriptional regulator [Chromobacterium violaceum]OQS25215.1 LysR family transcriptional regulator [Chromobacterium violaceum]
MKRLPDLEAWAIFAKVAECGSFARAADELALSQATVSKAVTRLEARMKTTLLHRTSRRLALTAAGDAALERAARILAEGEAVEADVAEQSGSLRGRVRVAAPMSFGISHLAPLLPEFMAHHPEVELDFHFSDEQVDLVAQRMDLALRIASPADSSLLARRLCAVRILLVGAPGYFERHGRPEHPSELARHRALQYSNAPGRHWRFRHAEEGEFALEAPSPLRVNNAEALTPALRAGLGLALQPEFLVWEDLRAGRLETAMAGWEVDPIALYILTPPGRGRPARVQALIAYLAEKLAGAPWVRAEDPAG